MPDYRVKFKCPNCGTIFDREIPEGQAARGNAGTCPNCKCNENTVVRETGQKLGRFEVVPSSTNETDGNKFEILMEADGIRIKKLST